MTNPAVAILPYESRLGVFPGRVPLDTCLWPLGRPARLEGPQKTLHDLGPDDHFLLFTRRSVYLLPRFGTKARVSLMVLEPQAIQHQQMRLAARFHRRFYRILASNPDLLASVPNGHLFPLGGSWIGFEALPPQQKTAMCSLIASGKRDLEGHALRHSMVDWVRDSGLDVAVMGKGYQPFDSKIEGLGPYRFSVVIENVSERNFFTEKLVDAVLCGTVPIYWGCPNLDAFMDTSGMVICRSEQDLRAAVHEMSVARYNALSPALIAAQDQAARYSDIYLRAARAVLD